MYIILWWFSTQQVDFMSFTPQDYIKSINLMLSLSNLYNNDFVVKLLKNISSVDENSWETLFELIHHELENMTDLSISKNDNLITTKRIIVTPSRIIYCFPNSWIPNRAIVSMANFYDS